MIERLQNTLPDVAKEIIELQKRSYPIEARLLGVKELPPMADTAEQIENTNEMFFGFREGDRLLGVLGYEELREVNVLARLAVHPDYLQQGIASSLLEHLLEEVPLPLEVMTGRNNTPAIELYEKYGFHYEGDSVMTEEGIELVRLVKA